MMRLGRALAALSACASLGACATVVRGTTTEFRVVSTPPGATVTTTNGRSCVTTPCSMTLPRRDPFDVTVSLAGYKPVTTHVGSSVSDGGTVGFLGNALVGGVIGATVDIASGAMNDLKPNPLTVTLEPAGPPATASSDTPTGDHAALSPASNPAP